MAIGLLRVRSKIRSKVRSKIKPTHPPVISSEKANNPHWYAKPKSLGVAHLKT